MLKLNRDWKRDLYTFFKANLKMELSTRKWIEIGFTKELANGLENKLKLQPYDSYGC